MSGIRLRHIAFTGPNTEPVDLKFVDGLNIIYGASNTGKSFATCAILFMLGVSKSLPAIDEIASYDAVWLGLSLPGRGEVTLYRATQGGPFKLYEGLVRGDISGSSASLSPRHDAKRTNNVSYMLLDAMGLARKQIVRDADGTKTTLSINLLSPYAVVSEEDIIAARSPVYVSGAPTERTFEQNLFKLLLTGRDDAAAVTLPQQKVRKAAKDAKIELVDELIAQINSELGANQIGWAEAEAQLDRLDQEFSDLLPKIGLAQRELDSLVTNRRRTIDRCHELQERATELDLTLQRFAKLQAVYSSDLERLQSIEEGGYVLVAMTGMECPVCGAPPDAQKHNHAADEISMAHAAAAAEARKIECEQRELTHVVASLEAEVSGLRRTIANLDTETERLNALIQEARPQEASLRESYETYSGKRVEITKLLDLYERQAKLEVRRAEIDAEPTKRRGVPAPVGPDATTVFAFGETVKTVLGLWRFPDADKAQFDAEYKDITIRGKLRAANGKGVRAILHAAFNVAVIVYCIENKLPHPAFLVLDTPLLTYREPLTSRHGELSEDEAELKATNLAEHFYKHLASLATEVQIIIIENSDPPVAIRDLARIETFTGSKGNGRFGLLSSRA
ncbi:hypothetical protein UB44_03315 [Burkholderiaceae bacterium 26]|nr:hypothetical protein UB44_03315 [Burkholderiaceae bacterium 26]